ncbi:MAG: type secretion system protein [Phycisphaerales bacterium]|nr:type secretion system protein [Phycisphaerales bacterium]
MRNRTVSRGFTLVELLVVIGIIALLVAILVPALAVAQEQARGVKCLSNLRQVAMAASIYCDAHRGTYPIAYYIGADGTSYSWDFTAAIVAGKRTIIPGLLWPATGGGGLAVQQCPSYDGPLSGTSDPFTGYNYNTSFIGHGQFEDIPDPIKVAQVRHPSTVALFGDGQFYAGPDKHMRSPFPCPGDASFTSRAAGTQGYRHQGRTNVAYCDGHAASVSDRFTATSDPQVGAGTGFLSSDNSAYDPG